MIEAMNIIVLKRMPIEKEFVKFKDVLCFHKGRLFKYREPLFEGDVVDIGMNGCDGARGEKYILPHGERRRN